MKQNNEQITIEDLESQIEQTEFNRQHNSIVVFDKKGEVIFDGILKDNETFEIYNEKQREAYKKKIEKENAMKEHIQKNEGGDFVHLLFKYNESIFKKLEKRCGGNKANIHIIRFILLIMHLNFNNNLYDDDRNRIKKGNLGKIWDTKNNRKSVYETFNILKEEGFIYETEEGYIMINKEIAQKGKVIKADDIAFTRLISKNIKEMYMNTDAKSRKQLANLFRIIPFINFKHNILCENPTEIDYEKIIPLTWSDLARMCDYDEKKQLARFKKDLFNITVDGYDAIGEFKSKNVYKIVINPKVYYGGNNIEDVQSLYALFHQPII